jgi:hypothetical protein
VMPRQAFFIVSKLKVDVARVCPRLWIGWILLSPLLVNR